MILKQSFKTTGNSEDVLSQIESCAELSSNAFFDQVAESAAKFSNC